MNSAIRSTLAVALTAIIVLAGCGGGGTTDPDGFERKSGSLSSGDDTLQSGEYSDEYTVNVEAGQMLEVSMTSTEIDPWIIVLPPSCDSVAGVACSSQTDNDDMESGNTDAYAWIKAEEAGTW